MATRTFAAPGILMAPSVRERKRYASTNRPEKNAPSPFWRLAEWGDEKERSDSIKRAGKEKMEIFFDKAAELARGYGGPMSENAALRKLVRIFTDVEGYHDKAVMVVLEIMENRIRRGRTAEIFECQWYWEQPSDSTDVGRLVHEIFERKLRFKGERRFKDYIKKLEMKFEGDKEEGRRLGSFLYFIKAVDRNLARTKLLEQFASGLASSDFEGRDYARIKFNSIAKEQELGGQIGLTGAFKDILPDLLEILLHDEQRGRGVVAWVRQYRIEKSLDADGNVEVRSIDRDPIYGTVYPRRMAVGKLLKGILAENKIGKLQQKEISAALSKAIYREEIVASQYIENIESEPLPEELR